MSYKKLGSYIVAGALAGGSIASHSDNCGHDPQCRYPAPQDPQIHLTEGSSSAQAPVTVPGYGLVGGSTGGGVTGVSAVGEVGKVQVTTSSS